MSEAQTPEPAAASQISKTAGDKQEFTVTAKGDTFRKTASVVDDKPVITSVPVTLPESIASILAADTEDAWDHFCQLNNVTGAGLTRTITEVK